MVWNGTVLTGPSLVQHPTGSVTIYNHLASAVIYHDEILFSTSDTLGDLNEPGALVCRSEDDARAGWHFPDDIAVDDFEASQTSYFQQIRTADNTETPSVSKLVRTREDSVSFISSASGYWSCRVDGDRNFDIRVGIYDRGIKK